MKQFVFAFLLTALFGTFLTAQDRALDYAQVRSDASVRDGVTAYHFGQYNKALLAFEKALQEKPENLEARGWMAQTLYMTGLEAQALNEWKHVLQGGVKDPILENWVEVLQARRSLDAQTRRPDRYLPLYELNGKVTDPTGKPLFMRPSAVRTLSNGGYLLAAFGSEEIIEVNANGNVSRKFPIGVPGIRTPFDILPIRDKYYVSEFVSDQISILDSSGFRVKSFGKKGRKEGEFLGPQFLATDGQALYVTDWGNSRVSKFDLEGNFLLQFGAPVVGFDGLKNPTGLAVDRDQVYVADKGRKSIFVFDTSGNLVNTLGEGRLSAPEGINALPDGRLLVSDAQKVFFLDPAADSLVAFDPEWSQGLKVTDAVLDKNQSLVLSDFDANKIRVLTEGHTIYSGLVVRPIQINTRNYPQISISFAVEDRWGRPITGLDSSNFRVTESKTPIVNSTLEFQGFKNTDSDVALVIDRDPSMARFDSEVQEAVQFFSEAWADRGGIGMFSAGVNPLPQNQKLTSVRENQALAVEPSSLTKMGKLDVALRLAASSMIPSLKRRTVVFVTTGTVGPKAFSQYNLSELSAYLRNNQIVLSVVSVNSAPIANELQFLVDDTGGKTYSIRQDLRPFLEDINQRAVGLYSIKYNTITPSEASTRIVPVTVEVQRFKQSGRGELSFYAPK